MAKCFLYFCFFYLFQSIVGNTVFAQGKSTIKGFVVNEYDTYLFGTRIELVRGKKVVATAVSDSSGRYHFKNLPAGEYLLTTKHDAYPRFSEKLTVFSGRVHRCNIKLHPYICGDSIIKYQPPLVDDRGNVIPRFSREEIKNTPR